MKFKGPFRKDRQTEDHIFSLQRLCSIRKFKNCKTYLAFLDLSKALDRVWCDGLFYLLWKSGIQGKYGKLLRSLYRHVSNKILFGYFGSEFFYQDCGLMQKYVLNPTLVFVLMNYLVDMLKKNPEI